MPRKGDPDPDNQSDSAGDTASSELPNFSQRYSKKKRFSMPESILKRRILEHQSRQRGRDDSEITRPALVMSTLSVPVPTVTVHPSTPTLTKQRKSMQEDLYLLKAHSDNDVQTSPVRRKSFDVAADGTERRPSVIGSLISRINLTNITKRVLGLLRPDENTCGEENNGKLPQNAVC
ncbi:hypothetical protein PoB_002833000 [Plakobranchus ocellatus]|uniref:Uncharacterized protein n=1 Tax=Plakobranchus ocellatus TaxID=259542 RepID=A0AAV4A0Z5_9GAST|nr:hypothetical protein PoB_002833000 [Plakobranchus ocellatus]